MTYPHDFVDSKVNNQLQLNDVSIMESNPQEQFQSFRDSQGSFKFQTDEEFVKASQVHSCSRRHCRPVVGRLDMYRTKAPYNGTYGAPDQGQMLDV